MEAHGSSPRLWVKNLVGSPIEPNSEFIEVIDAATLGGHFTTRNGHQISNVVPNVLRELFMATRERMKCSIVFAARGQKLDVWDSEAIERDFPRQSGKASKGETIARKLIDYSDNANMLSTIEYNGYMLNGQVIGRDEDNWTVTPKAVLNFRPQLFGKPGKKILFHLSRNFLAANEQLFELLRLEGHRVHVKTY